MRDTEVMIEQLMTDLTWEEVEAVKVALDAMGVRQVEIKREPDAFHRWSVLCYIRGFPPRAFDMSVADNGDEKQA